MNVDSHRNGIANSRNGQDRFMAELRGPNRTERFLRRLEMAGAEGICLAEVDREDAYTMRNACATARQMGHNIRSERCRKHRHSSTVSRYFREGAKGQVTVDRESDLTGTDEPGAVTVPVAAPLPLFPDEPYRRSGAAL